MGVLAQEFLVVGYDPQCRGGRKRFWDDMDRNLDNFRNGYTLCILGDLNGGIGDRTRAGITGAFGVPGENVVEFCEERGLCVGNIF